MKIIFLTLTLIVFNISSFAQSQEAAEKTGFVPVVDMKLKGLLGGSQNGKWLKTQEAQSLFQPETEFVLIDVNKIEEGAVTSGNKFDPEVPCEEFYRIEMELNSDSGVAIGSEANWNIIPREVQKLENNNKTYLDIVKKFLDGKGLSKTTVKIDQIYKADLDDDKQDEVIIGGTFYKNGVSPTAKVGDYSFVMVRKISGKKVDEILLDGDFIKKNIEFGAPNAYEISGIADLNGDGKMEVVVYGEYYEGAFSSVYEINGNKATKVLQTGCGV